MEYQRPLQFQILDLLRANRRRKWIRYYREDLETFNRKLIP